MGNILAQFRSPQPIVTTIDTKDIIVKNKYPNSQYYSNLFLREYIAEHSIRTNFHQWIPLGTNYDIVHSSKNGLGTLSSEVSKIYPYFKKEKMSFQYHMTSLEKVEEECYILLSIKQRQMLELTKYIPSNHDRPQRPVIKKEEVEISLDDDINPPTKKESLESPSLPIFTSRRLFT